MSRSGFGIENRAVKIPTGSVQLEGELNIPAGARGIALFAHDSGSRRRSPRNGFVANVVRQAGIGTLLFDLLTKEEEAEDKRAGHLRFDIGLLAERLTETSLWLERDSDTWNMNVGYFADLTVGAAALAAAAELGADVKAVVSCGGRPDSAGEKALSKVVAPTLLIVGERDTPVIEINEWALEILNCEKKLKIVPNASHLFEEPDALEEAARLVAEWFRRYLND